MFITHDLAPAASSGDLDTFEDKWSQFKRALKTHMAMEDRGMFPLLNEVASNPITDTLALEHTDDLGECVTVDEALAARNADGVLQEFTKWREHHLHHLKHEEEVMMPLIPKTVPAPPNPTKLGRVFHDRVLSAGEAEGDFDWFVGWNVKQLSGYGSTSENTKVATRVWVWGLQNACTPAQWEQYLPFVKDNASGEVWQYMVADFKIDGPGMCQI